MKLDQLQSRFQNYILRLDDGIEPYICTSGETSAAMRLEIYAEAYRLRLAEVLNVHYPILSAWIGEDEFDRLAIGYIDTHPSRNYSVREFGEHLSDFLSKTLPWGERPVLAEMARFEWALTEVFDVADVRSLQHEDLASIPAPEWQSLRFSLHPGIRRQDCHWNTVAIWQAVHSGKAPPVEEKLGDMQGWLVWRSGQEPRFRPLIREEANIIDGALGGNTFSDLCGILSRGMEADRAAGEIAAMLGVWVRDGLITAVHTTNRSRRVD